MAYCWAGNTEAVSQLQLKNTMGFNSHHHAHQILGFDAVIPAPALAGSLHRWFSLATRSLPLLPPTSTRLGSLSLKTKVLDVPSCSTPHGAFTHNSRPWAFLFKQLHCCGGRQLLPTSPSQATDTMICNTWFSSSVFSLTHTGFFSPFCVLLVTHTLEVQRAGVLLTKSMPGRRGLRSVSVSARAVPPPTQ